LVDAVTGEVRAELTGVGADFTISADGRWIASAGDAVEVWSVPPPRATLWSIIAGITLGLTVIGLGIWRH
jgi:hypothetical protein